MTRNWRPSLQTTCRCLFGRTGFEGGPYERTSRAFRSMPFQGVTGSAYSFLRRATLPPAPVCLSRETDCVPGYSENADLQLPEIRPSVPLLRMIPQQAHAVSSCCTGWSYRASQSGDASLCFLNASGAGPACALRDRMPAAAWDPSPTYGLSPCVGLPDGGIPSAYIRPCPAAKRLWYVNLLQ